MKIAVYTITRDEEENVPGWLHSIGEDADEIVVADTGSTDRTVEWLERSGVNVFRAHIDPFRYDDARNCALATISADVDLCVRLDADERLPEGWRRQIDEVWNPACKRYRYQVVNHGSGWGEQIRDDIHARHGFRWNYPTHEVLEGPMVAVTIPMVVTHHPDETKVRDNLDTLRRAAEAHPEDHRMAFYFGRELYYQGIYGPCREQMVRFLDLPNGWNVERGEAWRILAAIDTYPERWLWKAVAECPERREPFMDLARHFAGLEHWSEAYSALVMAAGRDDRTMYPTDQRAWDEGYDELREEIINGLNQEPVVLP